MANFNLTKSIQNHHNCKMTLIILYILWGAVGTPIIVAILTFLLTAIHIYFENIWNLLIRQNVGYREWNRLRKEWNKTAAIERRRQFIMSLYLDHEVKKQGLSE